MSSSSQSSDDEKEDIKDHYTSTGIMAPAGQSMSEITVERLTSRQISAELDDYCNKCKRLKTFCRLFDSKALVKKSEVLKNVTTKVAAADVRRLAL
jgi:hypothetical protein